MNLMSRMCLLNQAACSPRSFDDVHHRLNLKWRIIANRKNQPWRLDQSKEFPE